MNRYQQGKIYKIWNSKDDAIYVGSTCKPQLSQRMSQHRATINNAKRMNEKLYTLMRVNGKENFFIELVEAYACNSKDELTAREGFWIRNLKPSLNRKIEGRTNKQWRDENKQELDAKKKQYYLQNKTTILEKNKQYQQENQTTISNRKKQAFTCECGVSCRTSDRARHNKTYKHKNYEQYSNSIDNFNLIDI